MSLLFAVKEIDDSISTLAGTGLVAGWALSSKQTVRFLVSGAMSRCGKRTPRDQDPEWL